jgi:hypothetical protein
MEKIVLSGGYFGGVEVLKSEFNNQLLEKVDEQGLTWIYDLSRSEDPLQATFVGTK